MTAARSVCGPGAFNSTRRLPPVPAPHDEERRQEECPRIILYNNTFRVLLPRVSLSLPS